MEGITVLSLFDGISCGMIALERARIKVDKYIAFEIEHNAIEISKKNYPTNVKYSETEYYTLTLLECERLQTLPDNYTEGLLLCIEENGIEHYNPVEYLDAM